MKKFKAAVLMSVILSLSMLLTGCGLSAIRNEVAEITDDFVGGIAAMTGNDGSADKNVNDTVNSDESTDVSDSVETNPQFIRSEDNTADGIDSGVAYYVDQSITEMTVDEMYNRLYQAISAGEDSVCYTRAEIGEENWSAFDAVVTELHERFAYNQPELSWQFDSQLNYTTYTNYTYPEESYVDVILTRLYSDNDVQRMQAEIDAQVEAAFSCLSDDMSDFERILTVHDWLAQHIVYSSNDYDQNLYGALVNGACVCAGYTNAFSYLMTLLGYENECVIGAAGGESHAWNCVIVDGVRYYVDVTWDDSDSIDSRGQELVLHTYFMVSGADLSDRIVTNGAMPIDDNEGPLNYYVYNGLYFTDYSRDTVKSLLSQAMNSGENHVTFRYDDAEDYEQSTAELIDDGALGEILQELGYVGTYRWLSPEHQSQVYVWNIELG